MEYLWLAIYIKLDYLTYINLFRAFKDVKDMYINSQDKDKFLRQLRHKCIHITYSTFLKLVDGDLKLKAIDLYNDLKKRCIKIISINSKYYPKNLINIFNPPLILFAYGNLSLLRNKLIYVHFSETFSESGKLAYKDFCKDLSHSNVAIVSDSLIEYSDIVYSPYIVKTKKENTLVISDNIGENSNFNYEYITGMCDFLFVPEASYNIKIAVIVDLFLEQGKDILAVPSSIYNKEAYFSNYLIRDGAICINSISDLLNFLK